MLSHLKVLVIALFLKVIMKHQLSIIQREALTLLLIRISVNQLRSFPEGTTTLGLPLTIGVYLYTMIFAWNLDFRNWSTNHDFQLLNILIQHSEWLPLGISM